MTNLIFFCKLGVLAFLPRDELAFCTLHSRASERSVGLPPSSNHGAMSSSLLLIPAAARAFAPSASAHIVPIAPHGRGFPSGSRPHTLVMSGLPNLTRLAEQGSLPEEVGTYAPPSHFVSAFRRAAASRGAPPASTLRRNLAQPAQRGGPSGGLEPTTPADASGLEVVSDANFREAVLASSQRAPVLLHFYGESCGPCHQVEPAVASEAV